MAVQSGNQVSTRFSDVSIVPEVATEAIELRMLETNAFLASGVMVRDPELDSFLSGNIGGKTIAPRFIGPLSHEEPNISTDNPADKSTPKKITAGKNLAVRQSLNQSWSVMDLVADQMGVDPVGVVTNQIGDYWSAVMSDRNLASLRGLVAADLATNAPVLTVDVSGETGADALFNADAFIDAQATMGDRARDLTAVAMHSVVYSTMQKQDLIEFIPNSQGKLVIPTYMGLRVIVDDAMTYEPAVGADPGPASPARYFTYLFGRGAIAFGLGTPKTPFAIHRDEAAGNGGGEEVVHSRYEFVLHPQGFSFKLDTTPTLAELRDAENWTRNYERKRIPLAALITQG
ncbi:major capsid protein [uncultured Desulfovibrio sp.]|uniref:major capsid protein n=1 Tax=uncultured Desulfovibrio sp. TaxID=167968 RepID=UPI00272D2DA7|nr:major capsid protein [uncultured Desulfovibrio sp.]